jgi:hypothetical protein
MVQTTPLPVRRSVTKLRWDVSGGQGATKPSPPTV